MASKNISEFPAASTIGGADLVPIWKDATTKKITFANLQAALTAVPSAAVHGVADDSEGAAGIVGQVLEDSIASGDAVAVALTAKVEIGTLTLTPGDWDVSGVVVLNNVQTGISDLTAGIATPAAANLGDDMLTVNQQHDTQIINDGNSVVPIPVSRFRVAAATTQVVKLAVHIEGFPNGLPASVAWGRIVARRMR